MKLSKNLFHIRITHVYTFTFLRTFISFEQDTLTDDLKQKIAAELNLSETAFVSERWNKTDPTTDKTFTLRWFTPEIEVPLCGHATLATARALFETMDQVKHTETDTTLVFETKFKGTLTATMNWSTGRISLDFPLAPPSPLSIQKLECLPLLLSELMNPLSVDEVDSVHYSSLTKKLLVRLRGDLSESNVENSTLLKLKPNFNELTNIKGIATDAVFV